MNLYQVISDSPWLTFFLLMSITSCVGHCWSRLMRHLNIRKHGWPPEHLDADGDFPRTPDQDE